MGGEILHGSRQQGNYRDNGTWVFSMIVQVLRSPATSLDKDKAGLGLRFWLVATIGEGW